MAEKYPLVLNGTNIEELQSGDSIAGAIDSVSEDTSPSLGGNLNTGSYNVSFGDNAKALFGAGNDLQIYHDSQHSYVWDAGAGNLILVSDGSGIELKKSNGEYLAAFSNDGASNLYYDNSNKLQTTSTGVSVTGNVTATSFTGDGSNLTNISAGAVLQVKTSTLSVTQSWTGGGYTDVSNLSVTITPSSSSSKFLIIGYFGAISSWESGRERTIDAKVLRNGSAITGIPSIDGIRIGTVWRGGSSESDGNHPRSGHFTVMDEPATTSSITYKIQARGENSSATNHINRSYTYDNINTSFGTRTMSTITVMEIAV